MVSMAMESVGHTIWAPGMSSLVCVWVRGWGEWGGNTCRNMSGQTLGRVGREYMQEYVRTNVIGLMSNEI